ncbi:MAG: N-acetylmuramoyl-L-alanine amidase [Bacteriovoracia bacterium]
MANWLILVTLFISLAAQGQQEVPKSIWKLYKTGQTKGKDVVTTTPSLTQFCGWMGCQVFYDWPRQRAVVKNLKENTSAIISSATKVAIADGKLIELSKPIEVDSSGYLIPFELASPLVIYLKLGRIEKREKAEVVQKKDPKKPLIRAKYIIIDPGHGGNDFGTTWNPNGKKQNPLQEKDITLIFARKLKDAIEHSLPEYDVLLTRSNDIFTSLPERAKIANDSGGSIFVSLHVNHSPNIQVSGVETYILSPNATDDEAKRLAILENESWLKSQNLESDNTIVKSILVDIEQYKFIEESAKIATLIQQELKPLEKTRGLKNRGVKQAMFYVLSQAAMPSVLIEIGFLSNRKDRERLLSINFQKEFVSKVVSGLKRFEK